MGCLHNCPGLGAHGFEFGRPLSWVIPTPLVLGLALTKRLHRPQWKISGCVIDLLQRPLVFILLSLHKRFWGNKWPCLESYIAKNLQMASRNWHGLRLIARKKWSPPPYNSKKRNFSNNWGEAVYKLIPAGRSDKTVASTSLKLQSGKTLKLRPDSWPRETARRQMCATVRLC